MLLSEITGFNKLSPAKQKHASMEAHEDHQEKMDALVAAIKIEMKLSDEQAREVAEYAATGDSHDGKDIAREWGEKHGHLTARGGDGDDSEEVSKMLWDMFDEELGYL